MNRMGRILPASDRKPGGDVYTVLIPAFFMLSHILLMFIGVLATDTFLNVTAIDTNENTAYQISGIVYSLMQIWLFGRYLLNVRRRQASAVPLHRLGFLDYLSLPPLALGALGFAFLWFELLLRLSERIPALTRMLADYERMSQVFTNEEAVWLSLVAGSVLVPFAEELLFRGIIFHELRRAFSPGITILLNAFLFAVFHWNLIQGGYVFLAGLVFAAAYYWSGTFWVPVLLHMIYNFFGGDFVTLFLPTDERKKIFLLIQLIMIPCCLLCLAALRYRYQKRRRRVGGH